MHPVRVSVIIPSYNYQDYIRDRIESGERGSVKLENLPTDILNVLEVVHP